MYETIISCNILGKNLGDPEWIIVDSRYDLVDTSAGRLAYSREHIPGAVYVDLLEDLSGPPVTDCGRHPMLTPDAMIKLFSHLGIKNDRQVVVYDDSNGGIAGRLWWMLRYMGHQSVAVLDGGWREWKNSGYKTEAGVKTNMAVRFEGQPKADRMVLLDQITEKEFLVDSRDPARYRGENEPIDRVPGHIPGAVNRFWQNNLTTEGRFKEPARLKQEFVELLANANPENIVFYCGSGVTACHNLLAMVHAGMIDGKLYSGSWSEWCSDPARPVATTDS